MGQSEVRCDSSVGVCAEVRCSSPGQDTAARACTESTRRPRARSSTSLPSDVPRLGISSRRPPGVKASKHLIAAARLTCPTRFLDYCHASLDLPQSCQVRLPPSGSTRVLQVHPEKSDGFTRSKTTQRLPPSPPHISPQSCRNPLLLSSS